MAYKTYPTLGFKALTDEGEGVFEAIVAVFGNVDRLGDKIIPGAFTKSLAAWKTRGRPIPVIFSHRWNDLDAHIGHVLKAEERNEGLYVKGQLDVEEDFARRVWRKMCEGLIADFSFAYEEMPGGTKWVGKGKEYSELGILEVGPTLAGVNPETRLIGVKEFGQKPYPNEHACRLREPGDFQDGSFRRISREHEGKEYAVILGRLEREDALTEQAYRYPVDDWNADQARAHCAAHDGRFEAAAEKAQEMHDMAVELGAKCTEHGGGDVADGDDTGHGEDADHVPPRTPGRNLLAARVVFGTLVHEAS